MVKYPLACSRIRRTIESIKTLPPGGRIAGLGTTFLQRLDTDDSTDKCRQLAVGN
jgi:hypothetical protein